MHTGYEYARTQNPTRMAFERCIADLEGGTTGSRSPRDSAASGTVLELLDAGSHMVAVDDMYGGSWRLFERVRKRTAGLRVTTWIRTIPARLEKAIPPDTKMIWVETPSNPLLKMTDLAQVGEDRQGSRHSHGVRQHLRVAVLQRPLELGIDMVVHSVTKYINGHSDMVGGVVVVGDNAGPGGEAGVHAERDRLDPRSVLQLSRLARSEDAAVAHAAALRQRDASGSWLEVASEGRAGHLSRPAEPSPAPARRQADERVFGAMIAVYLKTDMAGIRRALEACQVFTLAESLGGVESLIGHPGHMSHGSLPAERRAQLRSPTTWCACR